VTSLWKRLVGCRRERVGQRCVNAQPVFTRFSGEKGSDDLIDAECENSPLIRSGWKNDVSTVRCGSESEWVRLNWMLTKLFS
jgi:hypothetical protein